MRKITVEKVTPLSEREQEEFPSEQNFRLDCLTLRECEVVGLVGRGAANKEMGNQLGVTERTIKAHLTAIFQKLGLSSRTQLALFMIRANEIRQL